MNTISHEIINPIENLDVYFRIFQDPGSLISKHWHNSLEIIYLTSGCLTIMLDKETIELQEDDCILINTRVVHSTHCKHGNTSIMVQIPSQFLRKYLPDYDSYYFDLDLHSKDQRYQTKLIQLKKILKDMEVIETFKQEAGNLRFTSLLFELLFQLYHNFRVTIGSSQLQQTPSALTLFEPVFQYTNAHYKEPISISDVSELVHLQPQYFCRKFKQAMGETFLNYLNEIRLGHIYQDLLHTDETLYSILEKHGFTNYKLFRKTFFEKFHCTPREIRKHQ